MNLIELELKKFKLKPYIKGLIISIICIIMFLTMSIITTVSDPEQTKNTYESIERMINLLVTGTFMVYSSVLMGKMVIGEYVNKTILIMFSYPVHKKKFIATKLFMISIFTMVSILIGFICCTIYVILADYFFDALQGSFQMQYVGSFLKRTITAMLIGGTCSLIPFIVGMRKRSISSTVVTAIIIVGLMQPIMGRNPGILEIIFKVGSIALISLLMVVHTMNNEIGKLDNL